MFKKLLLIKWGFFISYLFFFTPQLKLFMDDLIFVSAYCPTEEQEKLLEKCIDSLIPTNKHILLVSHTHIPIHIQKKCHYYVYDYNNEVSEDPNLLGFSSFYFGDSRIQSIFFSKVFYGFAIYRMMCIAAQIAINFGYKNLHHIEYDTELFDINLLDQNSNFLEVYDSVLYSNNGKEDGMIFGAFSSFKVSSLPEGFKSYSKDFIQTEMEQLWPKQLETFTKKIFTESGRVLFMDEPSHDKFKRGCWLPHRNSHFTLFYNPNDKTINLFYKSLNDSEIEEVLIIVNKNNVININVKPQHWHMRSLGSLDEITHVKMYNSTNVIYEKHFDPQVRNIFKTKSYISNI
jgi:hypothetical protein